MYFVLILLCQTAFGFMESSVFVMNIVSMVTTLYITLKLHGENIDNNSIISILIHSVKRKIQKLRKLSMRLRR